MKRSFFINTFYVVISSLALFLFNQLHAQTQNNIWIEYDLHPVYEVDWSPDNSKSVSVGRGSYVFVWNSDNGNITHALYHPAPISIITSVSYSNDGSRIASGSYGNLLIWDGNSFDFISALSISEKWLFSISWSPNDEYIALETDGYIYIIDPYKNIVTDSFSLDYPNGGGLRSGLCWLDNKTILAGNHDGYMKVYAVQEKVLIDSKKYSETTYGIYDISLSPDKKLAALCTYQYLYFIDTESFQLVKTLKASQDFLWSSAWSPDGRFITTSGNWRQIKFFDVETFNVVGKIPFPADTIQTSNSSIKWSADGSKLLVGSKLFPQTGSLSLWEINLTPTSVYDLNSELISSFELFQNYPNPFNPSTTINFSIPHSDFTTLKVFSLLGEEIATLISAHLQAGSHSIQFDASNLQSGVYFYTLQYGSSRISKKMLLLK